MFEDYPNSSEITRAMRPTLHPLFQKLPEGISEFTFANMYLFRDTHHYRISRLPDKSNHEAHEEHEEKTNANSLFLISGKDGGNLFFMLPFGLPEKAMLDEFFEKFGSMKCVSQPQSEILSQMGYHVEEDRDNFDYIYLRTDLTNLSGRQMHKRKNLLNSFLKNHNGIAKPLLDEYTGDALAILEQWRAARGDAGDYAACREGLELMYELQLCGGIYYVGERPVGFTLGEENALGTSYVIHFEKAVDVDTYKGLYQFINQTFSSFLPDKYATVNREQDLGEPGLRRAKESYNPIAFVKKFHAHRIG
jgi:hypothetical protein